MKTENNKIEIQDTGMEFNLINGEFTLQEALELINNLLQKKMDFHELKSFSSLIRTGDSDLLTINRMSELKQVQSNFMTFINEAKLSHSKVVIQSTINIKLIK